MLKHSLYKQLLKRYNKDKYSIKKQNEKTADWISEKLIDDLAEKLIKEYYNE